MQTMQTVTITVRCPQTTLDAGHCQNDLRFAIESAVCVALLDVFTYVEVKDIVTEGASEAGEPSSVCQHER